MTIITETTWASVRRPVAAGIAQLPTLISPYKGKPTSSQTLIRLVVRYEVKVNDKCVNKPSDNSSGNATEHFRVWLPVNNKLSSFAKAVESLSSDIFFSSRRKHRSQSSLQLAARKVRKDNSYDTGIA